LATGRSWWSFIKLLQGMLIFLSAFLRSNLLLVTTPVLAEQFREISRMDSDIVVTAYVDLARKIFWSEPHFAVVLVSFQMIYICILANIPHNRHELKTHLLFFYVSKTAEIIESLYRTYNVGFNCLYTTFLLNFLSDKLALKHAGAKHQMLEETCVVLNVK
jgi:hypothetical protein